MVTRPRETVWRRSPDGKPAIVTVAGCPTERFLIVFQVSSSGFQVRCAACWGVNLGSSLVSPIARESISPKAKGSPAAFTRMGASPSVKSRSIRQTAAPAEGSRQRNAGANRDRFARLRRPPRGRARGTPGRIEIDSPFCGARGGVAPEERRGGDLRWKYRALCGIVDHNRGGSGGGTDRFTLRTEATDNH